MYQKALERLIHLPTHPVRLYPLPHVVGFENGYTDTDDDMISDYTFTKDAPKVVARDRHSRASKGGKREHDFAKETSNFIQRNPKFTLKSDCQLADSEVSAICKVTDLSLPYPEIVLQTRYRSNPNFVCTLLLAEHDSEFMHENHKQKEMQRWTADIQKTFKATSFIDCSSGVQPVIALDTVSYEIQFLTCNSANTDYPIKPLDYGTFRYRILKNAWEIHDEKDDLDNDKNEYLKFHVDDIAGIIKNLCIALAYPAITRTTKVAGSKPMIKPPMKNLKASSFHKRPVWEHTTLEIDLYNDTSEETDATRSSVPKRLHGVRKHLRKCHSGKLTWVKAHTRGNKSLGGLTKDYDLIT